MTMCRRITSQSSTTSMDTLLTGIMLTLTLQMGKFLFLCECFDIKLDLIDSKAKSLYTSFFVQLCPNKGTEV